MYFSNHFLFSFFKLINSRFWDVIYSLDSWYIFRLCSRNFFHGYIWNLYLILYLVVFLFPQSDYCCFILLPKLTSFWCVHVNTWSLYYVLYNCSFVLAYDFVFTNMFWWGLCLFIFFYWNCVFVCLASIFMRSFHYC